MHESREACLYPILINCHLNEGLGLATFVNLLPCDQEKPDKCTFFM